MDGVQFLMSEVIGISDMVSDCYALKCLVENMISCMYCFVAYKFRILGFCQNSILLHTGM
jgi:hypothetical protein